MLALYLFAQVSLRNLQVLSHLPAVLEQGQVAICDPDQLGEGTQTAETEWTQCFFKSLFLFLLLPAFYLSDVKCVRLCGFTATGNSTLFVLLL